MTVDRFKGRTSRQICLELMLRHWWNRCMMLFLQCEHQHVQSAVGPLVKSSVQSYRPLRNCLRNIHPHFFPLWYPYSTIYAKLPDRSSHPPRPFTMHVFCISNIVNHAETFFSRMQVGDFDDCDSWHADEVHSGDFELRVFGQGL